MQNYHFFGDADEEKPSSTLVNAQWLPWAQSDADCENSNLQTITSLYSDIKGTM